jgi:hypothetical protein
MQFACVGARWASPKNNSAAHVGFRFSRSRNMKTAATASRFRALDCRVSDLTGALEQPDIAPADFAFLKLMTVPGAVGLLQRYEAMTPESRRLLIDLLKNVEVALA